MAETSMFWDGTVTGDATEAPYDAATEFAAVMLDVSGSNVGTNLSSVFVATSNLAGANPAGQTVRIAPGRAIVWGTRYVNDANIDTAIPIPASATRIDTMVVRKSWTDKENRLTRIAGVEGGSAPALTQVEGVTWDMPLYNVSITTGGVITLTDRREFILHPPTGTASGDLGGTYPSPTVVATHLTNPLPVAQGGTGASSLASSGVMQFQNAADRGTKFQRCRSTAQSTTNATSNVFISNTFTVSWPSTFASGPTGVQGSAVANAGGTWPANLGSTTTTLSAQLFGPANTSSGFLEGWAFG